MLLPALGKARQKAQAIACASKLKEIITATIIYIDDNDGYIPDSYGLNGNTMGSNCFPAVLYPILHGQKLASGSPAAVHCPSAPTPNAICYGIPHYIASKTLAPPKPRFLHSHDYPSKRILAFEGRRGYLGEYYLRERTYASYATNTPYRHGNNDSAHCGFMDGHVELKTEAQFFMPGTGNHAHAGLWSYRAPAIQQKFLRKGGLSAMRLTIFCFFLSFLLPAYFSAESPAESRFEEIRETAL